MFHLHKRLEENISSRWPLLCIKHVIFLYDMEYVRIKMATTKSLSYISSLKQSRNQKWQSLFCRCNVSCISAYKIREQGNKIKHKKCNL